MEAATTATCATRGRALRVASELEKLNSGLHEAEPIDSAFVLSTLLMKIESNMTEAFLRIAD